MLQIYQTELFTTLEQEQIIQMDGIHLGIHHISLQNHKLQQV